MEKQLYIYVPQNRHLRRKNVQNYLKKLQSQTADRNVDKYNICINRRNPTFRPLLNTYFYMVNQQLIRIEPNKMDARLK